MMCNADIRIGINHVDIENMILSTFLFLNDLALDGEIENYLFKLDDIAFTSKFRKRVAEQINSVTDDAYSFLSYQIEEKCMGTTHEQDFINIISQSSRHLSIAKRYHDDLVSKNKFREIV